MNLTLSADADLIRRAREVARSQGTSLNEMVRQYLRTLTGQQEGGSGAEELFALMDASGGDMGGEPFRREDVYDR